MSRVVTVPAARLRRWLDGFTERHAQAPPSSSHVDPLLRVDVTHDEVVLHAIDGAVARCRVPFPPLAVTRPADPLAELVEHVERDRRVGVVLVRRGGYAAGVFDGARLVASKVGSRHVQGRTAAGGQSQQRFARRREKQAREAFEAAADVVARIVLPHAGSLEAVVTGGDRAAVATVLADRRLTALRELVVATHLNVPDPRQAVLVATPKLYGAVEITVTEPDGE